MSTAVVPAPSARTTSRGAESFVYKIVESAPLPIIDLSKSVRSVWFNERLGELWMRFLRHYQMIILRCYYVSIVLVFAVFSTKKETSQWLAIAALLTGFVGALSSISMLRSDIVILLSGMYEVWFFSIVNTVAAVLLALHLLDLRALVVLPFWLGVQSGIFLDANITMNRHFVFSTLMSVGLILLMTTLIGLGLLDTPHSFVVFPSLTRSMTAEIALVNCLTTIAFLLSRNMYRRRLAVKKYGFESKRVQCISFRIKIRLVRVCRDTDIMSVAPLAQALVRTTTQSLEVLPVQMDLVSVDEEFDSVDTVFQLGHLVLVDGKAPSWLKLVMETMAYSGFCLTLAGSAAPPNNKTTYIVCLTALVMTGTFSTATLALYQRRLLRRMVYSFDYAFLSFQIILAHASMCDLLYWDYRCMNIAASLLWVHWVLLFDTITPVTKRRWGITHKFAGAIMVYFIAYQVMIGGALVFDSGLSFQDRSVLDVAIFGRTIHFRTVPLFLSRTATLLAWSIRVLWRIAWQQGDDLIIMQGGVVFESNMRSLRPVLVAQQSEYLVDGKSGTPSAPGQES